MIAGRGERSLGGWVKSAWLAVDGPATIADTSDLSNAELLFAALDRLELESGCLPEAAAIDAAVAGDMASPVCSESAIILPSLSGRYRRSPDGAGGALSGDRLLCWTPVATGPDERGIVLASRADSAESDGSADALERWMRRLGRERESLELGRIAYVASTRARRRLHLIGTAGLRETSEGPVLRPPRSSSLLGFLWPVVSAYFEQALAVRSARPAGSDRPGAGRPHSRRRRLGASPLSFSSPAPLRRREPPCSASRAKRSSIRPEFDWAGEIAKAVGQIVHDEFQRIAEGAAMPKQDDPQPLAGSAAP